MLLPTCQVLLATVPLLHVLHRSMCRCPVERSCNLQEVLRILRCVAGAGWRRTYEQVNQREISSALLLDAALVKCRMVLDWKLALVGYPGEVMTDMDYSIYPEGFYEVWLSTFSRHPLPLWNTF